MWLRKGSCKNSESASEADTYITYQRRSAKTGEMETIKSRQKKPSLPSTSTKKTEASHLRAIFEQARKWGYIEARKIPTIKTERLKSNRRPAFEIREYRRLIHKSVWRWKDAPNERVRLDRMKLHDWLLIMANSGMRPTEAKDLRWKDVQYIADAEGSLIVSLWVHGKGKRRQLIAQPRTRLYLNRLRERSKHSDDEDPVFCNDEGIPIESFKNGFDALLKHADLLHDRYGEKRAPYPEVAARLAYGWRAASLPE